MGTTDVSPMHVPYPEAGARQLRIVADGCQIRIQPGVGDEWLSGTYQDPSGQRSLSVTSEDGTVTIDHIRTETRPLGELAGDPYFDLKLGRTQPYALTIEADAIESESELGGLPLTRLVIRQRAGRSRIYFSERSPLPIDSIELSSEGAVFEAHDLANASAAVIALNGDAGAHRLDFGGLLQRDSRVDISTRASSLEIIVPQTTPARLSSTSLMGSLDVGAGFSEREGAFWTPAMAGGDRPLLTVDASVEVGQLKLRLTEG